MSITTVAVAGSFSINKQTIDGGGLVQTTSTNFNLSGTVGQPDADTPMTSANFTLSGGFWPSAQPKPEPACLNGGDFDADGDVDLVDFGQFQLCFTGGMESVTPNCECADFDGDLDADLVDFGEFQLAFTGG